MDLDRHVMQQRTKTNGTAYDNLFMMRINTSPKHDTVDIRAFTMKRIDVYKKTTRNKKIMIDQKHCSIKYHCSNASNPRLVSFRCTKRSQSSFE